MRRRPILLALGALAVTVAVSLVPATAATGRSRAREVDFRPPALPPPSYAIDATTDRFRVTAGDGVSLFVEAWLPRPAPATVPAVVTLSPYAMEGRGANTGWDIRELVVPRGYAHVVVHVRGTGSSGGCADGHVPRSAADAEAALLGILDRPWSDGRLALVGLSNPAGEALNFLARTAPGRATAAVKALAVGAPPDQYDYFAVDGVPRYIDIGLVSPVPSQYGVTPYSAPDDLVHYAEPPDRFVQTKTEPGGVVTPDHADDRIVTCDRTYPASLADDDHGSMTPWYRERRWKADVDRVSAPTLFFQGFDDLAVPHQTADGLFDRLGGSHAGVFGRFTHKKPPRSDWDAMTFAWLERWVRGVDNGADRWPVAQIEGLDGTWRADGGWPRTGGPALALALAPQTLGTSSPRGATAYTTGAVPFDRASAPSAATADEVVFDTAPLTAPLHLTGTAVLDLAVSLSRPDAHLAAELIPLGPEGDELPGATFGARSMRHLEPFDDTLFAQEKAAPAPSGRFRTAVRFAPLDTVIPAGGRLRLRLAASARTGPGFNDGVFADPTVPEPGTIVTIHHDCTDGATSVLHLLIPRDETTYLRVGTDAFGGPGRTGPGRPVVRPVDGGGIGRAPICGSAVLRHDLLGPATGG
jgi:putative CocE/NonD family hydrolase